MRYYFFFVLCILLYSCNTKPVTKLADSTAQVAATDAPPAIQLRSATDLKEKGLKSGKILIDVRTPEEIAEGKIDGAGEIDFMAPDFKDQINALDKSKDYVMYCRSGGRSGKAAELMIELGFVNVTNITGGFMEYSK